MDEKSKKKLLLVTLGIFVIVFLIVMIIIIELSVAFFSFTSVVLDIYIPKYKGWETYEMPKIQIKKINYSYEDLKFKEKSLNLSFNESEAYYDPTASTIFHHMLNIFYNLVPSTLSKEKIAKILKTRFGMEEKDYTISYIETTYYANTPILKFLLKGNYKGEAFELAYISSMPCDINALDCDESFFFVTNSKPLLYSVASSLCGYVDYYKKGLGTKCMEKTIYKDKDIYAICFEFEGIYRRHSIKTKECSSLEG